jgi:hypothetical protein
MAASRITVPFDSFQKGWTTGGWRLEVGGWRSEAGGRRLKVGGWRLKDPRTASMAVREMYSSMQRLPEGQIQCYSLAMREAYSSKKAKSYITDPRRPDPVPQLLGGVRGVQLDMTAPRGPAPWR